MTAYRTPDSVDDEALHRAARGLVRWERTAAGGLELRWPWQKRQGASWYLGALVFGLSTLVMGTTARSAHATVGFGFVFCALLTAPFGYLSLAYLFNRTVLAVDREQLVVRHAPIPWKGTSHVIEELRRVYVDREVYGRGKSRTVEYRVMGKTKSEREVLLVNGVMGPDRAEAVAGVLGVFLRLAEIGDGRK